MSRGITTFLTNIYRKGSETCDIATSYISVAHRDPTLTNGKKAKKTLRSVERGMRVTIRYQHHTNDADGQGNPLDRYCKTLLEFPHKRLADSRVKFF